MKTTHKIGLGLAAGALALGGAAGAATLARADDPTATPTAGATATPGAGQRGQHGGQRGSHDAAALAKGELTERDGVHHDRGRRVELTLHRASRMVVDGELVELDHRDVAFQVADRPVRVVVG